MQIPSPLVSWKLSLFPLILFTSIRSSKSVWPFGWGNEAEIEVSSNGPVLPVEARDIPMTVTFINNSPVDADIYWDDGSYGVMVVPLVSKNGGKTSINTHTGHTLFWTVHGRRQQIGVDMQMHSSQLEYKLPHDVDISVSKDKCADRSRRCKIDVGNGECERNPGWMIVNCPKSCNACHMLDPNVRCSRTSPHLTMSNEPVWQKGDLDKLFESIMANPEWQRYSPTALSRPPAGPWIVTFENIVTDLEIDALTHTIPKLERSTDTGAANEFGEAQKLMSTGRTSENAWCINDCYENEQVRGLTERIEDITRIPEGNFENFQVLRYTEGQYYRTHHDMSESDNELPCGPRILTFFLYMSDVEEGGGTNFPRLNLTVTPKKGGAVLWPSVRNDDPTRKDSRTTHQALPVTSGVKYAANAWIHLYDFKIPNLWGCTGSFG